MSNVTLRPGARATLAADDFRTFFELTGRLARAPFLERFPMPFLMTEANTDPLTWSRARLYAVTKRRTENRIAIERESAADPEGVLESQHITVGRESRCDVVLPFPTVSKQHAHLVRRDRRWWVHDLGSANGTLLDGQEVERTKGLRIQRSPARLSFGPDATLMFLTPETLFEFMAHIRRVHGIEEPTPAPTEPVSPRAEPEDFAVLAQQPVEDEKFSRVITLSKLAPPTKTAGVPTGKTAVDPARGTDDERFQAALRAIEALGDMVDRLEVSLETRGNTVVLFAGGPREQLVAARRELVTLRPRIVAVKLTSSLGEPVPYEIYVRRA